MVGGALQEGESVLLRSLHQRLLIRRRCSIDELCYQRSEHESEIGYCELSKYWLEVVVGRRTVGALVSLGDDGMAKGKHLQKIVHGVLLQLLRQEAL